MSVQVYANSLPLIRANARLRFGHRYTYNIALTTPRDDTCTIYLIGYIGEFGKGHVMKKIWEKKPEDVSFNEHIAVLIEQLSTELKLDLGALKGDEYRVGMEIGGEYGVIER